MLTPRCRVTKSLRVLSTLALSKPPVLPQISSFPYALAFLTHVSHTSRNTRQQPSFREMYSNVEVGDMSVSPLVKENIIGFKISAQCQ